MELDSNTNNKKKGVIDQTFLQNIIRLRQVVKLDKKKIINNLTKKLLNNYNNQNHHIDIKFPTQLPHTRYNYNKMKWKLN